MDALSVAHEINDLWLECLDDAGVAITPETCPGDRKIASVIEKHLNVEETRQPGEPRQ
jgi:hypothetical protein